MYVVSADKGIDLKASWAYQLYIASGDGDVPKPEDVAASTYDRLWKTLHVFEFLGASCTDGVEVSYRSTDVLTAAAYTATLGAKQGAYETLAAEIWSLIATTKKVDASADSSFVPLAAVANALHRYGMNGHQWITADSKKMGTLAYRCTKVAGALQPSFSTYMATWGHDLLHCVHDKALCDIVDRMCGITAPTADGEAKGGDGDEPKIPLRDLVKLPESASDRWPPGTIGISSLVLGVRAILEMLAEVNVKVGGSERAMKLAKGALDGLTGKPMSREEVLKLKTRLAPHCAIAVGFVYRSALKMESLESHGSLRSLAEAYPAEKGVGRALGTFVADMEVDQAMMTAHMRSIVSAIAIAFKQDDGEAGGSAGGDEAGSGTDYGDSD
jgi:hypothetical protein